MNGISSTTPTYAANILFRAFEARFSLGPTSPAQTASASALADTLDIGNSRSLTPGRETFLYILEENLFGKVDEAFGSLSGDETEWEFEEEIDDLAWEIVDHAGEYYDAYMEGHGGETAENLEQFAQLLRKSVEEGLTEAEHELKEISGGFLSSDLAEAFRQTRRSIEEHVSEAHAEALSWINGDHESDSDDDADEDDEMSQSE